MLLLLEPSRTTSLGMTAIAEGAWGCRFDLTRVMGIGYGNESNGGVNNVAVLLSVEGQFYLFRDSR